MRSTSLLLALASIAVGAAYGLELVQTRTTGQYRVEATPAFADVNHDGTNEWVLLGEQGQVLVWNADLMNFGPGQDGAVGMLPKAQWSSSPAVAAVGVGNVYVFVSVDGKVIALDEQFAVAWQHQLAGPTTWSRATPLVIGGEEPLLICGDHSGTLTALSADGSIAWSKDMGLGPCETLIQPVPDAPDQFLAPLGTHIACMDRAGAVLWKSDLGEPISARAEVVELPEGRRILCGTSKGTLAALDMDGTIVWKGAVGDELDCSISLLARTNDAPLIVATGLWGNLYAFDTSGRHVWTHLFRAKNRARPVLIDCDQDGQDEVVIATYGQRIYVVNAEGRRVDEIRVSGTINSWPVLYPAGDAAPKEVVFITGVLLAHRYRIAPAEPIYASVGQYGNLSAERAPAGHPDGPAVLVKNPSRAFVCANVVASGQDGAPVIAAALSARETIVIPVPPGGSALTVELSDPAGGAQSSVELAGAPETTAPVPDGVIRAWATPAYATFDPAHAEQHAHESADGITVYLYQNEVDQGACVVASGPGNSAEALFQLEIPKRDDGAAFAGTIALRKVVLVPTANGEMVADALPDLGDAGLIELVPDKAVKLWVSVDSAGAEPGEYWGILRVTPLADTANAVELPLTIDVSELALPDDLPLTFCTWDYMPNNWFPNDVAENLDDMGRHGVDVFPRSTLPVATYANGALAWDWAPLDAELDRLQGRGEILFHVGEPAMAGAESLDAAVKRKLHLEYYRAFRDHLHVRGLNYEDYAFYPVDEPGLDYGPRVPVYIAAAELVREADPKFRMYTDPVPGLSGQDYERIAPLVDVWCPNMRMVNGILNKDPRILDIMASGKPVWSYECVSQVKSLSPLRYNRANAWRAQYFGLDGIGHWTYGTTQSNHWFANTQVNDEYAMVYPGERPVPSVRWEAARDGLEDMAALGMLQSAIDHHKAAGTKPEAVVKAEAVLKGVQIEIMELSDQVYAESRDFLKQGDRRLWHTWWDVMQYQRARRAIEECTVKLAG